MMADHDDALDSYNEKRDFGKTGEPAAEDFDPEWSGEGPIFVIHKHDASNLHYDFRFEVDGVLASFVVPKGPSTDPGEKRLALRTEDHPMAYADFEGTIPEDEYGGGTVMVWDRGTYTNPKDAPVTDQLDDGHVTIQLDGEKLSGGYALTQTGDERWLLVKMDDDEADARRNPVSTEPDSVKTGRSLEDIADDG